MESLLLDRRLFLLFPALIAPFLVAAVLLHAWPTRKAVILAVVPAVLSPFLLLDERIWIPIFGIDVVILVLFTIDLFSLWHYRSQLGIARCTERIVSLAKRHLVTLRIENRSARPITLLVRDDADDFLQPDPFEFEERTIPPRAAETLEYHITPIRRGGVRLEHVYLRLSSVLRFWRREIAIPCETDLHIYPDLKQLDQYEILANSDRLHQLGVRRARRVGQDNDFERLRDYQLDDNYKSIDWRATARRNKLIVKDFQVTRSQRIVFLIDCGRMMTGTSGAGMSMLDHALNAALMLGYVALRQGDAVGMVCFSNRLIRSIPARSGRQQMNRLLHAAHDIFPESVETRFDDAFFHLATHYRKRSLVTLLTNINDPVNTDRVRAHLIDLVGRHLPLGVFLRDRALFQPLAPYEASLRTLREDTRIDTYSIKQALATGDADRMGAERKMWLAAAAAEIVNVRQRSLLDLAFQGAMTLDLYPEEITAPLINKYLEIKARHLL